MHIQHVTIHTAHDIEEMIDFYQNTLRLPLVEQTDRFFTLRVGYSMLTVQGGSEQNDIHHLAFNIPAHLFDDMLAEADKRLTLLPFKGKNHIDFSQSTWRAKSFYFEDPAGNVLEYIARERLETPDAQGVLGISEVGFASDDLPALVSQLQTAFGLPVFDGDPEGSFCALGDDNGLFICVEAGRNWLPTDNRPSGVYPLNVTIQGEGEATHDIAGHPYTIKTANQMPSR